MPATEAEYHQIHHVPARQPTAIMPRAQEERPQRLVKRYRTEIAASTSSMFSTVLAFPLDSVKTRMQTYRYEGFLDCVRHTYRTEKLRGFFRGKESPFPSVPLPPPPLYTRPLISPQVMIPLTNLLLPLTRRPCPNGQYHTRPNHVLFDLPTRQTQLLGLG